MYVMTGEFIGADGQHVVNEIDMSYEPIVKGEDTYLYFYVDMNNVTSWDAEGRFNGARFDANEIKFDTPGRNAFDVCYMALFRTVEEAEQYIYDYLGVEEETEPATTEPVEVTTEPVEVTTEPAETEVETNKTEQTTAPKADETDKPADEGGCGSVVGFGAIAIVAVAAVAGMVSFKKKED